MDTNAQASFGYSIGCGNFHFIAAKLAIERAVEIEKINPLNPHDELNYIAHCCNAIISSYCGFEAKIEEKIGFIETERYHFENMNSQLISFLNEIDSREEILNISISYEEYDELKNMNDELVSFFNEMDSRKKMIGKRLTTIEKYKKISKLFNISISCKEYDDIAFIKNVRDQLVHSKIYSKIYRNGNESTYGRGKDAILKVTNKYLHYPEVKRFRSPFDKNNAVNFPHLIANALFAQWCLDTIKKFIENSTLKVNSIRDYFPHPCKT
jgi:hypothetical protein